MSCFLIKHFSSWGHYIARYKPKACKHKALPLLIFIIPIISLSEMRCNSKQNSSSVLLFPTISLKWFIECGFARKNLKWHVLHAGWQCSGDRHGAVRAAGSCAGGRRRDQPLPRLPRHCRPPPCALRAPTQSTPPQSSQANYCLNVLILVQYIYLNSN